MHIEERLFDKHLFEVVIYNGSIIASSLKAYEKYGVMIKVLNIGSRKQFLDKWGHLNKKGTCYEV